MTTWGTYTLWLPIHNDRIVCSIMLSLYVTLVLTSTLIHQEKTIHKHDQSSHLFTQWWRTAATTCQQDDHPVPPPCFSPPPRFPASQLDWFLVKIDRFMLWNATYSSGIWVDLEELIKSACVLITVRREERRSEVNSWVFRSSKFLWGTSDTSQGFFKQWWFLNRNFFSWNMFKQFRPQNCLPAADCRLYVINMTVEAVPWGRSVNFYGFFLPVWHFRGEKKEKSKSYMDKG